MKGCLPPGRQDPVLSWRSHRGDPICRMLFRIPEFPGPKTSRRMPGGRRTSDEEWKHSTQRGGAGGSYSSSVRGAMMRDHRRRPMNGTRDSGLWHGSRAPGKPGVETWTDARDRNLGGNLDRSPGQESGVGSWLGNPGTKPGHEAEAVMRDTDLMGDQNVQG